MGDSEIIRPPTLRLNINEKKQKERSLLNLHDSDYAEFDADKDEWPTEDELKSNSIPELGIYIRSQQNCWNLEVRSLCSLVGQARPLGLTELMKPREGLARETSHCGVI